MRIFGRLQRQCGLRCVRPDSELRVNESLPKDQ